MIVRLLIWSLGDALTSLDELHARIGALEPLPAPGGWLLNDAAERFGALVVLDDPDEEVPPQLAEVRSLVGRDPDVFEEFDVL